jgi:hypothetical protein
MVNILRSLLLLTAPAALQKARKEQAVHAQAVKIL